MSRKKKKMNRINYFSDDNTEDIIKPLNLRIPFINLRNSESLFVNSLYISKTNIYNNDKNRDINFFHIYESNIYKMKNYDTTLNDMHHILTRNISHVSSSLLHEFNYMYIMYKKFINNVYNEATDITYDEFVDRQEMENNEKEENYINSNNDRKQDSYDIYEMNNDYNIKKDSKEESENTLRYIKSLNLYTPYINEKDRNEFKKYIKELKNKMINCLEITNNTQIKDIYQKSINNEEIKINTQYIQYITKGDYIFVSFQLINPLYTKIECQGTHICAYYYNERVNKDILVEKKIFILEPRQARMCTFM